MQFSLKLELNHMDESSHIKSFFYIASQSTAKVSLFIIIIIVGFKIIFNSILFICG